MKKIITLSVCLFAFLSFGQQVPQYSQWYWNLVAINPAYTGLKPCLEAKSLYRNQWANLPGSPNSGFLTFCLPIATKENKLLSPRQGIGFKFEKDRIGSFTMNRLLINYAGHFNFTPDTRLSIGISAGVRQFLIDKSDMTTLSPDPVINQSSSKINPDAAMGFWWNGKNYFVSLSFSELIRDKLSANLDQSRFKVHTYLGGGFRINTESNFTLLPYILIRIPAKGPASMDLNLVFDYLNKFSFGLGFRNTDALNASFQYKFNERFSISYAFDYVISNLSNNKLFSHEFGLGFGTCKTRNTNKTICPLF